MKVNYTLPGLLPESAMAPASEIGEHKEAPFSAQLRRLRAPEITDWRMLLRLDAPPPGAASIEPPPVPQGLNMRDGASQRAWWRAMLGRHAQLLRSTPPDFAPGVEADSHASVQRMLGLLLESQRLEDEVFARHLAEGGN